MSNGTQKTYEKDDINIIFKRQTLDDEILNLELENIRMELKITETNQALYKGEDDIIKRKLKILEEINKIQEGYIPSSFQRILNRANSLSTEVDPERIEIMQKSLMRQISDIHDFNEENNRKLERLHFEYTETTETDRIKLKKMAKKLVDKLKKDIEVNIKKINKLKKEKNEILNGSSGGSNKKSGGKRKNITKKRTNKKKKVNKFFF